VKPRSQASTSQTYLYTGNPEKLRAAGVKPLVDLPGVGLNFQDHYLTFSVFRAKPETESFDDFVRGDPVVQKQVFDQWNINGTGPLATNGIEAGVKIRPTEEELAQMDSWPWYVFGCPKKFSPPTDHFSALSSVLDGTATSNTLTISL
jgi:choline dehydrogenase-like flavoprotein